MNDNEEKIKQLQRILKDNKLCLMDIKIVDTHSEKRDEINVIINDIEHQKKFIKLLTLVSR